MELDLPGASFARRHELYLTNVRALVALVEAERAWWVLAPSQLAQVPKLDASSVTAPVDRPQRMGHARRHGDPTDRRYVHL